MGMVVRSNIMAYNANRQLGMNNSAVSKSLEKLASGFRINRAGDDASGLAISEKMKAQIKGLETASANSQDGISLVQTAEGALTEVHSMLNRMVELATKSANGTMQDKVDREALQSEVDSLKAEINRIAAGTNFNGINLLDGSMGSGAVGASGTYNSATNITLSGVEEGIEVVIAGATGGTSGAAWSGNTLTITLDDGDGAQTQADIDALIKGATGAPSGAKGLKLTLDGDITGDDGTNLTLTAAEAKKATVTVGGIDFEATKAGNITSTVEIAATSGGTVGATVDKDGNVILSLDSDETYTADDINKMLASAGAGVRATNVGTIATGAADALAGGTGLGSDGLVLQVGDTAADFNQVSVSVGDMSAKGLGIDGLDISNREGAAKAIDTIKNAINTVSSNRADLGAVQNRLEYTINNLDVAAENMSAANSRIRDTDMAKEMMNYTKMNVLTQAAQAMLAQANQQPQSVLQLLQ